jgi:hypothetical protein
MKHKALWIAGALLTALCIAAYWKMPRESAFAEPPTAAGPVAQSTSAKEKAEPDASQQFHLQLLEIARTYQDYGRVDDETRWAPFLCRMPMPSVARFSDSGVDAPHGQKLYYVFAKNPVKYRALAGAEPQAAGQVVVKESWWPEEVDANTSPNILRDSVAAEPAQEPQKGIVFGQGSYFPYAKKEGQLYRAHEKSGMYIMMKVDPALPGTDAGWVYGTVTADGKTVTSAGRVASCMECHVSAPHDRLFGLPAKSGEQFPLTPE